MRKFWFAYLAKAMVIMPGGYGTLDEFMEIVTLVQTRKITKPLPIVLFGTPYWDEVLHLEPMLRHGMINAEDLNLFYRRTPSTRPTPTSRRELEVHALGRPGGGMKA
jgi:predicted Rossmann-fold nucleotide-binding protein